MCDSYLIALLLTEYILQLIIKSNFFSLPSMRESRSIPYRLNSHEMNVKIVSSLLVISSVPFELSKSLLPRNYMDILFPYYNFFI